MSRSSDPPVAAIIEECRALWSQRLVADTKRERVIVERVDKLHYECAAILGELCAALERLAVLDGSSPESSGGGTDSFYNDELELLKSKH